MTASKQEGRPAYQLKVTLVGIKPPIWRRIQVPGGMNLGALHRVLQEVMPWEDDHLHEFVIHGKRYGMSELPGIGFDEPEDECGVTLEEVVSGENARFVYTYDFGDGWEHRITVEKICPLEPEKRCPVCLAGKRACPPEDCGGAWGYVDLLEAIKDPSHSDHEDLLDWIGGDPAKLDPEAFDIDEVNRRLAKIA